MNQLYNELINGHVEYVDAGVIIQRPPSCLMLRAARTIKQLSEVNQANQFTINNLQNTETILNNQLHELQNQLRALQHQLSTVQEVQCSNVQPDSVEHSVSSTTNTDNVCND